MNNANALAFYTKTKIGENMNTLLKANTRDIDLNQAMLILREYKTLDKLDSAETLAIAWLLQNAQKKAVVALKPSASPFKLASLFIAKKDVRYYLNYIYADGEHLYSSNGHIAIRIKHKCGSGYYDALGVVQDVDIKYPDMTRIFNDMKHDNECAPFETDDFELIKCGKKTIKFRRVRDQAFNLDYLNVTKRANATSYYLQKDKQMLYFKGAGFDGVIMPIKV